MKLLPSVLAIAALIACSGNDESIPLDAAVDGGPDAAIDAAIDAPGAQRCVPSVATLIVVEGGTANFTVTLAEAPVADVTAGIASADLDAATVAPTTLVFTAANFNTPQTVTVSGVEDGDMMDETTTVTCTATGIPPAAVMLTVTDND
jgi:hypothetical protein